MKYHVKKLLDKEEEVGDWRKHVVESQAVDTEANAERACAYGRQSLRDESRSFRRVYAFGW